KDVPREAADHQEGDDVRQDDGEEQVRRAGRFGVEVDLVIAQDLLDLEGVAEDRLVVVALVIPRDLRAVRLDGGVVDLVGVGRRDQVECRLILRRGDRVETLVTRPDDRQQTREQDEVKDVAVSASHGHVILTPDFSESYLPTRSWTRSPAR